MGKLENKITLITGGGTGIGRIIALMFADEGADVAVCGRRLEPLEAVAEEIRGRGQKAVAIAGDIGAEEDGCRIVATTDKEKGHLRKIAKMEGYRSFIVPDGVGGRFSVLTPVGLLSAAASGINIRRLLAGAAAMDSICRTDDPKRNPAALNALLHYLLDTRKGKKISVMMPYVHRLHDFADWYRQLWAESLGKKLSLEGKRVNVGQTGLEQRHGKDDNGRVDGVQRAVQGVRTNFPLHPLGQCG